MRVRERKVHSHEREGRGKHARERKVHSHEREGREKHAREEGSRGEKKKCMCGMGERECDSLSLISDCYLATCHD